MNGTVRISLRLTRKDVIKLAHRCLQSLLVSCHKRAEPRNDRGLPWRLPPSPPLFAARSGVIRPESPGMPRTLPLARAPPSPRRSAGLSGEISVARGRMPSSRPHNFTSPWPDLFRPPTSSITASSRTPFTRDWLVSYTDDDSFRMPRLDSIARRLIEDWLHGR